MIGCIISFIAGGFAGALVMALCAASKNSNINIILEDTGENVLENKDVNEDMESGCKNCEPEHCKKDCCHNCDCSDGTFCDELEIYVTKGYGRCNHYEPREWEEEE